MKNLFFLINYLAPSATRALSRASWRSLCPGLSVTPFTRRVQGAPASQARPPFPALVDWEAVQFNGKALAQINATQGEEAKVKAVFGSYDRVETSYFSD